MASPVSDLEGPGQLSLNIPAGDTGEHGEVQAPTAEALSAVRGDLTVLSDIITDHDEAIRTALMTLTHEISQLRGKVESLTELVVSGQGRAEPGDAGSGDGEDDDEGAVSAAGRPRNPYQVHTVWQQKLADGSPLVVQVDETVRRYRMTIAPLVGDRRITAMNTVIQIANKSLELFSDVLDVALSLGANEAALQRPMLKGIAVALLVLQDAGVERPVLDVRSGLHGMSGSDVINRVKMVTGAGAGTADIAREILGLVGETVPAVRDHIDSVTNQSVPRILGPIPEWWK